jgi:hypothetical protein
MKRTLLSAVSAMAVAVAVCLIALPDARAGRGINPGGGKTKDETYIVIKITDERVEYKAITQTSLKEERKRIEDDYKQRYKEWLDARKTDPNIPRPVKPIIRTMPGATFQTQKGAQDYADKFNKEEEEKNGKKDEVPNNGPNNFRPPRR